MRDDAKRSEANGAALARPGRARAVPAVGRHRGRGRLAGALAATMAMTVLAASCGGGSSSTSNNDAGPTTTVPTVNKLGGIIAGPPDGQVTDGGKINYGIDAEPEGLDPTRYAFSQAGHAVASAVFEPLATLDENGQAIPYLATAFDHSPDYKQWTVTLPTGVKFHDGTALDADAVVQMMKAYQASAIVGAALNATVDSVDKTDATHVVFKLKVPQAAFPYILTTQAGYITAPAMLGNPELARKPIGTGPFVFDRHEVGKLWSFKKNPEYRQKGLPHLDSLDFQPISDPIERNRLLVSNDLDVIQTLGGPQILDLRQSEYKRAENRYGDKAFLMLNTSKEPFDNVLARRAVAFATDSAKWRREVFADVPRAANSPYGPGQPGFLESNGFPTYNLDEAKKLVKQYETETGKPLAFTFTVADDNTNISFGQIFSAGFTEAGMKVTLEQKPQINLLAGAATGQYQLSQFRLFAQPNPDADTHFYRSASIASISLNFPRYANPEVDAAINEATGTTDEATRKTAYEKISKIFAEQVPYVWLGQQTWMVAANPRVNGIYVAANGSIATVGAKTWIAGLSITR